MKIIKQGTLTKAIKTTPVSVSCSLCGFEAELDPGEVITQCPNCGSPSLVFTNVFIDPTPKKRSPAERFPMEYYHYSEGTGSVALSDQAVSQKIDDTVKAYYSAGSGYAFSSTGDTFVAVFQTDKDDVNSFLVMVSKDHYEYDVIEGE